MVTYLTKIDESELGESDMARFEGVFTPAQVMISIMPTMQEQEPLDCRAQKVIERLERLESGLGK